MNLKKNILNISLKYVGKPFHKQTWVNWVQAGLHSIICLSTSPPSYHNVCLPSNFLPAYNSIPQSLWHKHIRQAFQPAAVHSSKSEDANCYPASYPSSLFSPLSSSLAFDTPQLVMDIFILWFSAGFTSSHSFSQRHGEKPLTSTYTGPLYMTHIHTHITIWLPDLPVGPEQQSSAGRTTMTMQNWWTQRKGEGEGMDENLCQNLCFFHSYICRLEREREDSLFVSQQRKKKKVWGRMLDAIQQSGSPFLFQSIIWGLE